MQCQLSEEEFLSRLDRSKLPRHIAVIMDGNGRWAKEHGLPRLEGHRASRESIRSTISACAELGIEYLTLYTFSAENWRRPDAEVTALMALIEANIKSESDELHAKNVRIRLLGRSEGLPASLQAELQRVEQLTRGNRGLTLQLAINYGGRQEILDATIRLAQEIVSGALSIEQIQESDLQRCLYLPETPDPDLLVRTGGEFRVSNYLLWQIAYTEIYVTATLWPDFARRDLYEALVDFQGRQRRFGGVENAA